VLLETLCFHCQQTAEKSIKAVFVALGRRPPRTHNLVTLFESLPGDTLVPEDVRACAALSGYAVAVRYPDEAEDVSPIDYRRALSQAAAVLAWAQSLVDAHEQ
jgi:HEPN domain-containing protein